MQVIVPSHGPVPARVLVIGEHPSVDDERKLKLFSGLSGDEFKKMLHEAGFLISEIRFTSLIKFRPYANQMKYVWTRESKEANDCIKGYVKIGKGSDAVFHHPDFRKYISHIEQEILQTRPNVIITLGDAALWALTSTVSVNKWRGSLLETAGGTKVIPTYSPSQIMRMWEWRAHAVRDLERARFESNFPEVRAPSYKFYIRPTFREAKSRLKYFLHLANTRPIPLRLTADLETIARHIACIGFAWSKTEGMCIPFMSEHHTHFYSLDEEVELVLLIKEVTTHSNIYLIWQNGAYDIQHFVRHWGFRPNHNYDTLLGQHILFPGIPKDLGFQASMYCSHYVYWKDELTDYKKLPKDLDKFWAYNAKDCCHTYEIAEVTEELINRLGFTRQREFIHRVNNHVITMMIRGVRINKDEKSRLGTLLGPEIDFRQMRINEYVGQELNISSPKQMTQFFYDDLKLKPVLHKKTKRPTADKDALPIFAQREPILKPIVDLIAEARSIGVFYSTFVMMKLDKDGRMRTSYNVGGTETYRFSSSKNAFDSGGNMQNWPKGDEEEEHRPDEFVFPNVRRMVIPDPGYILFDVDLAGADAQIVAWEAEDDDLKAKFRSGAKIHALNAKDMYGASAGPDGKTPPYYKKAKMGCHLCVDEKHEALTPWGWKLMTELGTHTPILVCNIDGSNAHFELPSAWYAETVTTDMVHVKGTSYDQFVTANHKIPYTTDESPVRLGYAGLLPESARVPRTCKYSGTKHSQDNSLIRMLCAFHADGTISSRQVHFHFRRERKITRMILLLTLLKAEYDVRESRDGTTLIVIRNDLAAWLIAEGKQPTWDMLKYSGEDLDVYLEELVFWDGTQGETSQTFYTSVPLTAEVVHTLLHLRRKSGSKHSHFFQGKDRFRVQINNRQLARVSTTYYKNWTGKIFCPTTSTGWWFTRRNGRMAVTGNTNYGGTPSTLAKSCGMTMHEAELFQRRWFAMHPGIKTWHEETLNSLMTTRSVRNKFGFRRYYFDRIDGILPQALAWIPQSTVAIVINHGLCNIAESGSSMELLMQVHDSLVGQMPKSDQYLNYPILHRCLSVTVPYTDPLVIGTSLDVSKQSWGDLVSLAWADVLDAENASKIAY